jgi:uncharacterized membrane protein YgaE (UPF0421/DUF939 family)
MGGVDQEPDPRRRIPTVLWLILGLILVAMFAAVVFLLFGHGPPHALGPPAGAP